MRQIRSVRPLDSCGGVGLRVARSPRALAAWRRHLSASCLGPEKSLRRKVAGGGDMIGVCNGVGGAEAADHRCQLLNGEIKEFSLDV